MTATGKEVIVTDLSRKTSTFEKVIIHLLTNAKDAVIEKKNTQQEFFDMNIGIKSSHEKQFLIIEVSDNGIGIINHMPICP